MEVETADDKIKDEIYYEQRMSKAIMHMPESIRDKLKLLKVLHDKRSRTDELIRQLNLKYEQLKAPLYDERAKIIKGEEYPASYISKFDQKHESLKSSLGKEADEEDCQPKKVNTDDLVESKGVPGFWLKVLKNHNLLRDYVKKHDEPILKELMNISGHHYPDRFGYQMTFTFRPNEFMQNTILTKIYHMADESILEKTESSEIQWKEGKNPIKKKVSKKQKNKKTGAVRTIKKTEDQDSFFTFFKSLSMPDEEGLDQMNEEDRTELGTKLDEGKCISVPE
jgi:nucleosome assembly protein 1-like 1